MAKDEEKKASGDDVNNVNDDYNKRMTMDNQPDPTAKRNVGYKGDTERRDQKDRLENLEIHGSETSGYGANNANSTEEFAQGPGFEYEGSETAMSGSVNGIRTNDQPLDEEGEDAKDKKGNDQ